ncbi:MAG: rod shape-determining protein RodA [Candidatus Omnitrophota bacterium]|nr:MAG: rod shape-determining protein RodA [Candidatus Omnitrophota bacterium]
MKTHFLHRLDFPLIFISLLISSLGLIFLKSATYTCSSDYLSKQMIWLSLGILSWVVILKIGYQQLAEFSPLLYLINLSLLLFLLFAGSPKLGAQRWLHFKFITFQPSEFFKVVLILFLSRHLSLSPYYSAKELKELLVCAGFTLVPMLLIVKQPDLGTSLVLGFLFLLIIYLWGIRIKYLIFLILTALISSPLLWHLLKEYQKKRLLIFLNPHLDPLGAGYTVIQSKIAIGSGGMWGKGWLAGTQSQLNFLPEHHTDFIFSVIGEEWGFVGAGFLLLLYLFLILRAIRIAKLSKDEEGRLIAGGIAGMFLLHIFINVGMSMGIMPITGLPLLLISYGGSSLLTTFCAIGILLSIDRARRFD